MILYLLLGDVVVDAALAGKRLSYAGKKETGRKIERIYDTWDFETLASIAAQGGVLPSNFGPFVQPGSYGEVHSPQRDAYIDAVIGYVNNNRKREELEQRWLAELAKPEPEHPGFGTLHPYDEAMFGLATMKSDKALAPLVNIAAERVFKDNAHRHFATKALGMLGNPAAIPDLILLVYHFNMNTRWESQVSLVRLTGQNFGTDAKAWGEWYNANRENLLAGTSAQEGAGVPAKLREFDATPVDWTCGQDFPELRKWSDPKVQEESDRQQFGGASSGLN